MNFPTPSVMDGIEVEPAVFDASPLILLDALGYISQLPTLFPWRPEREIGSRWESCLVSSTKPFLDR
jgi:hypothetical protein